MKRSFRKLTVIAAVFALTLCLFGCGAPERTVAGEEYILRAREEYKNLDSARVDVINDDTGESEQIFIYKYDEKDLMTYSYIGKSEDTSIAQYNNGYEQFTDENGKVTALTAADAGFCAYTRDVPYPYADEGLILFYKKAVDSEVSYIAQNEQAIEVCHIYDVSKVDGAPAGTTAFKVMYYFDGEGNLLYLKEITEITLEDGTKKNYSYSVYITERNNIDVVNNVVDTSDGDEPEEYVPDTPII